MLHSYERIFCKTFARNFPSFWVHTPISINFSPSKHLVIIHTLRTHALPEHILALFNHCRHLRCHRSRYKYALQATHRPNHNQTVAPNRKATLPRLDPSSITLPPRPNFHNFFFIFLFDPANNVWQQWRTTHTNLRTTSERVLHFSFAPSLGVWLAWWIERTKHTLSFLEGWTLEIQKYQI